MGPWKRNGFSLVTNQWTLVMIWTMDMPPRSGPPAWGTGAHVLVSYGVAHFLVISVDRKYRIFLFRFRQTTTLIKRLMFVDEKFTKRGYHHRTALKNVRAAEEDLGRYLVTFVKNCKSRNYGVS